MNAPGETLEEGKLVRQAVNLRSLASEWLLAMKCLRVLGRER